MSDYTIDYELTTKIFRQFDHPLWIATASDGQRRGGLLAGAVMQASTVPECPRVLLSLGVRKHTWSVVEASGAFALHLFGGDQSNWAWHFSTQSGHNVDKFADIDYRSEVTGSPILTASIAWLDCKVEAKLDVGDRAFYVAEIVASGVNSTESPMTVAQMFGNSTPEQMQQLQQLSQIDCPLDAEAIGQWRSERGL